MKVLNRDKASPKNTSKVIVIGLGQLGLPVAKYVRECGFDTHGYDINIKAMERAEKTAGIKQAVDFGSKDFDVFILNVSTHKPDDMFSPQIDGLLSVVEKISGEEAHINIYSIGSY